MKHTEFRKKLMNPRRRRMGLAGLDTAIIMIAFIITASVLAYVAVNMGLFVTQKAKAVINNGEEQASTALEVGGAVLYSVNYPTNSKSYWLYFPVTPTGGVSSVQLSPATTGISFGASASNVALANIYNYTLLTDNSAKHMLTESDGGLTYKYYSSQYAALLDLNGTATASVFIAVNSTTSSCTDNAINNFTSTTANSFNFTYSGDNYTACVGQDLAFTFPIAGDSLVGSSIAPAGSEIGVMILFGPSTGSSVFQYQQIQAQITPSLGASLLVSEYVYQPEGIVTTIG